MKKSELRKMIREEIQKLTEIKTFLVTGFKHKDKRAIEKLARMYDGEVEDVSTMASPEILVMFKNDPRGFEKDVTNKIPGTQIKDY